MSNPDYTIRLGNGLYMDSTGRFIPGPLDNVPTIPAPGGGLPVSPEQAKKALEGISKSLSFEDVNTKQKLLDLGVPEEFINLLKDVAAVAGTLAKVVPYVGAVIALAEMLGFLKSGPDPIIARMEALFKELRNLIVAKDEKWIDIEVGNKREAVLQGLNAAEEYYEEITYFSPDPAELKQRLSDMRTMHQGVVTALAQLMNPAIWQSNIGEDYFKLTWPFNLHYEKGGSAPGPQDLVMRPTVGMDRFDHRVMVPVVCGLTQSYLTFIKTIVPEYRSSGEYSEFLADLALKIETLAEFMRSQTLARTQFTPYDFSYLYPKSQKSLFPLPWLGGYHVGAVDLCARNVPWPQVPYNFMWILDGTGAKVDYGALHFNWTPPVKLQQEQWGDEVRWRVLNPDECAAAANAQAEQDYGSILYSSGYMNLVQLAGLLRHLYTAPSISETVTGSVISQYSQGAGTTVTVTSQSVFPFGPATATAQRFAQNNSGRVRATTQPRGRLREFNYRVVLRTLPAGMDGITDYGEVFSTKYQNESAPKAPGTAPFSQLICNYSGAAVAEKVLATGKTPAQPVPAEGTATLAADTFDWWVPVPAPAQIPGGPGGYLQELRGLGWATRYEHIQPAGGGSSSTPTPPPSSSSGPTLVEGVYDSVSGLIDSDLILGPTPQPVGQRREVERRDIEVSYTLLWDGIDLRVTLETRPQDRNVDLYVVVEETIANGQVLHTAFQVPMTGQITYVPEQFFKDEAEVIEAANAFWRDLIDKYSEQVEVSPLDPIAQVSRYELTSIAGMGRVAELVRKQQPAFLETFMRERPMTQASAGSPRFVLTRAEPSRVGATPGRRRR
jgi:hypothetical protein